VALLFFRLQFKEEEEITYEKKTGVIAIGTIPCSR
jgi:hypothetical protein